MQKSNGSASKLKPDHWVSWAVVHDHWKPVANRDLSHFQLFDIAKDVKEARDLKKEHPVEVEKLLSKLRQWQLTLPEEPSGDVF